MVEGPRGGQEVKSLERLDAAIGRLEKTLMVIFLGAMILLAFAQIVLRNFSGAGLDWAESLVRYLVLWVGFIGASLAAREGRHITIEVFKLRPSATRGRFLAAVSQLCAAVVCAAMTWAAVKFVRDDAQIGNEAFLDLPTWVLETIIPVTFGIMSLRFLIRAVRALHRDSAAPGPASTL
jgi:C4-dicarboxylate transporter, DctQ subunit